MKRGKFISIILATALCCFFATSGFAAKKLLDDFSGPRIDTTKWTETDLVREIDTTSGKLVLKLANKSGSGDIRNSLAIKDPDSKNAIKCDVKLVSTQLDSGANASAFARVGGFFYNTQTAGGATGDIFAAVLIGDKGQGPEAYYDIVETLNDELTDWKLISSERIVAPGSLPGESQVEIVFNGTDQFDFIVNGTKVSFTNLPTVERPAVTKFKGLHVGLNADTHVGDGYVHAEFDNVFINEDHVNIYDSFSSGGTDLLKWNNLETVRETADGKLRLNAQADGATTQETVYPLYQENPYFEAKVMVESGSKVSTGASGITRIAGFYYNEKRGPGQYNGYQDDVWVDLRLILGDSGGLIARCFLVRIDTPDDSTPGTELFGENFNLPITFDTFYTLSIEQVGTKFIFKVNDETKEYDVLTPMYQPSEGQHRQLRSRVYADPGETGYMKARLDDVYVYSANVVIDAPQQGFIVNGSNYTSFTVAGTGPADEDVEVFAGATSLGSATAGSNGAWSLVADFSKVTEGAVSLTATDGNETSSAISGTFDMTAPSVSSTDPADDAVDVSVKSTISAVFSEAMDDDDINANTFTVSDGVKKVSGTLSYSGKTATFTPTAALEFGTTYTAIITDEVEDEQGNHMAVAYSWSFTTEATPDHSEAVGDFVTRFYRLCLGRDPDAPGLSGWVKTLMDGSKTGSDVANGFVWSNEFLGKNTSNEEFLQILYEAFFNRQPDPGGWQAWLDAFAAGKSRQHVLDGFIYASEFANLCDSYNIKAFNEHITKAQMEAVKAFVTRFYQLCLDRNPDGPGLDTWSDNLLKQIQSGADVAFGFMYSPEFLEKKTSIEDYLLVLYKAFFDRDPDQGGWDTWKAELASGMNRLHVLNGFIYSAEFGELCKRFGISPFSDPDVDQDGDGYSRNQGDCNDRDSSVYLGAAETCSDGIDQDCDGYDLLCPEDADNDGDGYSVNEGDCNDADSGINPGASEICEDGIDQDCNGSDLDCSSIVILTEGRWTASGDKVSFGFTVSGREITTSTIVIEKPSPGIAYVVAGLGGTDIEDNNKFSLNSYVDNVGIVTVSGEFTDGSTATISARNEIFEAKPETD